MSTPRSTFKSPFAAAFKSGIKSGTPCGAVITAISKKTGKPASAIMKSLSKAGWCWCQKFNGSWICWPTFACRSSKWTASQTWMWQYFVDWCCMSGVCTPWQLANKIGAQKAFMWECRNWWTKQWAVSADSSSKSSSRRGTWKKSSQRRAGAKVTWAKHSSKHGSKRSRGHGSPSTWGRNWNGSTYKFPKASSNRSRRHARAA